MELEEIINGLAGRWRMAVEVGRQSVGDVSKGGGMIQELDGQYRMAREVS